MSRKGRGVGEMAQVSGPQRKAATGAFHAASKPGIPGPGAASVVVRLARKRVWCLTCQDQECVGHCRFS